MGGGWWGRRGGGSDTMEGSKISRSSIKRGGDFVKTDIPFEIKIYSLF